MYYYSASSNSFYHAAINKQLPTDAVPISNEMHRTLMNTLATGKQLSSVDGFPITIDSETAPNWQAVRSERNVKLKNTDYTQLVDFNGDSDAWAKYRQELRDIPQTFSDPGLVKWPIPPQ